MSKVRDRQEAVRKIVREFLWQRKIRTKVGGKKYDGVLAEIAERELGLGKPELGEDYSSPFGRVRRCARFIQGKPLGKRRTARPKTVNDKFYKSHEWARARFDALAKNDGRCELCGRSKHDGVVLQVDHIKNLREHWDLRLDPENHQVLCMTCNWGKGNRSDEDWREPHLVTLMGERID